MSKDDLNDIIEDEGNVLGSNTKINTITIDMPCCDDGEELFIRFKTPKKSVALQVWSDITSHLGIQTITKMRKGGGGT